MNKIVLFGSIGIARRVLDEIVMKRDVEILGVCCEQTINDWRKEESVYQYAKEHNIPILSHEDIPPLAPDLGLSIRYNRLIKPNVIDAFRLGIVNTHGGILPEYRGYYCNVNALINGETEYGVTLHYIAPGVDDGDIIDVASVNVSDSCTGMDLYEESERLCYELVERNLDQLLAGTNRRVAQAGLIVEGRITRTYRRDTTLQLKDLTGKDFNDPRTVRIIRAFDSPHHEPAFMVVNGEKIYLRYRYGVE